MKESESNRKLDEYTSELGTNLHRLKLEDRLAFAHGYSMAVVIAANMSPIDTIKFLNHVHTNVYKKITSDREIQLDNHRVATLN
jgi:hypothetical protein